MAWLAITGALVVTSGILAAAAYLIDRPAPRHARHGGEEDSVADWLAAIPSSLRHRTVPAHVQARVAVAALAMVTGTARLPAPESAAPKLPAPKLAEPWASSTAQAAERRFPVAVYAVLDGMTPDAWVDELFAGRVALTWTTGRRAA
jgi:hypothetical protein